MKFEPGKEYRTRDGRRARVYAVDGDFSKDFIHGAIEEDDCYWVARTWKRDGTTDITKLGSDLMPNKKKIEGWLWVDRYGVACFHTDKPAMANLVTAAKRIFIEYEDGEFDE